VETRRSDAILAVTMDERTIRVLAVGRAPTPEGDGIETDRAEDLSAALDRLANGGVDVVLAPLDLGTEAFRALREEAPDVPLVAVTDDAGGLAALEAGAYDYVGPDADPATLLRAVRYATSLHRLQGEVFRRQVTDELTGLYNARGFEHLATHHLRLADRTLEPVVLVFVRLDDLPGVSQTFGAGETPRLLTETAEVLRQVVRDSDVLARVGVDAFAVLLSGNALGAESLVLSRLVEAVAARNARSGRPVPLSLSVGAAHYEPGSRVALARLMDEADRRLRSEGSGA
jgi:diguanylate cyclase (GGDEF)-like protein